MKNRWSDTEALELVSGYGARWGRDPALRAYASRLLGAEESLVLHGGGNTSVKSEVSNVLGENVDAIFVKSSGTDLARIGPEGHTGLDLGYLKRLRSLEQLSDRAMLDELMAHRLDPNDPPPSIEALLHAFIPRKYIDHTHADSILALTNRAGGEAAVREALGEGVIVLDYIRPGFELARAAASAYESSPEAEGMVLLKHGIVTWGDSARESYERTISLVTKAEEHLGSIGAGSGGEVSHADPTPVELARGRYIEIAPVLRGALALPSGDGDRPHHRFILRPLIDKEVLGLIESDRGKEICVTPPLTSDHLIRTKSLPLWLEEPGYGSAAKAAARIPAAIADYAKAYDEYFRRNEERLSPGLTRLDSMPRVILMPGLGAVCAGKTAGEAEVVRDITEHTLRVKAEIARTGTYEGLDEKHLFDMEYFSLQHMKLDPGGDPWLGRSVALVTGAAGAIGSGICERLLERGCHVVATDLPGARLESLAEELRARHGERALAEPMDVTDPRSVSSAWDGVMEAWGGVDFIVINAGVAHVSSLAEMDPEEFAKAERVNVHGTLNVLSAAARHFKAQGTGGDVVVISTKNVFAPGAEFGAYSATKAAAHQLGRIASLEMAPMGVRVNMVSPDAVFGEGDRRSGLWAEVGPGRMRARGLDEKGLEEYYRNRNLLKTKVTASHVAEAVAFFISRLTPTTGATLPVDGGLPDSTPR